MKTMKNIIRNKYYCSKVVFGIVFYKIVLKKNIKKSFN